MFLYISRASGGLGYVFFLSFFFFSKTSMTDACVAFFSCSLDENFNLLRVLDDRFRES